MKQKRTILFLTRLYHPHIGGVEKHVEIVAGRLTEKGFRVIIVAEQHDRNLPLQEKKGDLHVLRIPIPKNSFLKKFSIWKWVLQNNVLFKKAEIIHIHDVFFWILPLLLLPDKRNVFMTFHGYEGYPVKMKWKIQRKAAEWYCKGSICVGDFMKKWYFARPDYIIYGGVEKTAVKSRVYPQSAVFFGRLDAQTGIEQYIKAYARIKKVFPKFRFTVVGEGELETQISSEIKIVPFTKDIEQHISKNRFIFVSRYLSILEALVQKKEIIATYDNPVKRDYLKLSPFVKFIDLAKNDVEIAKFVINGLKNEKVNRKRVESGYKWAASQTWDNVADTYLRLWKKK